MRLIAVKVFIIYKRNIIGIKEFSRFKAKTKITFVANSFVVINRSTNSEIDCCVDAIGFGNIVAPFKYLPASTIDIYIFPAYLIICNYIVI